MSRISLKITYEVTKAEVKCFEDEIREGHGHKKGDPTEYTNLEMEFFEWHTRHFRVGRFQWREMGVCIERKKIHDAN
jgi:hypothetical protein